MGNVGDPRNFVEDVKRNDNVKENVYENNNHSCSLCSKTFPSEDSLYKHLLCCAIGEDDNTATNSIQEDTDYQLNLDKSTKTTTTQPQISCSNETKLESFLNEYNNEYLNNENEKDFNQIINDEDSISFQTQLHSSGPVSNRQDHGLNVDADPSLNESNSSSDSTISNTDLSIPNSTTNGDSDNLKNDKDKNTEKNDYSTSHPPEAPNQTNLGQNSTNNKSYPNNRNVRRSPIWDYFTFNVGDTKAQCNKCPSQVACTYAKKDGTREATPGNLWTHLKSKHLEIYNQLKNKS